MKARESGMPEEELWQQFFDVDKILDLLEINICVKFLVDFGFGYGTFTIPASKKIKGIVYSYDIDYDLYNRFTSKISKENIKNIMPFNKDFISEGTGLKDNEADYAMVFNILHAEKAADILSECFRILKNGGKVGVIHWNYDESTPRGPSMSIRPVPEDIGRLLLDAGFSILKNNINLPPYHYGFLAQKP